MPRPILRLLLLLCLALPVCAQPKPQTGQRRALVVANSKYTSLPAVPGALSDAQAMADALKGADFAVTFRTELTFQDFFSQQAAFASSVQSGDVCLFYFSGYAIQDERSNYLLPVDFDPGNPGELQTRSYLLRRMAQSVDRKAALTMIVVEAARRVSVDGARPGLMAPNISDATETLFAFSFLPDQVTDDVAAPGRFTATLAQQIQVPGKRMLDVFEDTRSEVSRATKESQVPQVPLISNTVSSRDFFFHDPPPEIPKPPDSPLRPGVAAVNRRDRLEYVWIPHGKFKMGCVPGSQCKPEEQPQHEVTITKDFWMGMNEVTVVAYRDYYVDANKRRVRMPPGPTWDLKWKQTADPIVNVSWKDSADYCSFMGGRLPTEAEWEYAARAGEADQAFPLNNENSRDKANFNGTKANDKFPYTAPVRSFDPNRWNLFDMSGNVWEWVSDFFAPNYFTPEPQTDPTGPTQGKQHVARGGSWDSDPRAHLRLSFRWGRDPGNNVGFRCVLEDNPKTRELLVPSGFTFPAQ